MICIMIRYLFFTHEAWQWPLRTQLAAAIAFAIYRQRQWRWQDDKVDVHGPPDRFKGHTLAGLGTDSELLAGQQTTA
jgi:hypothetical protein